MCTFSQREIKNNQKYLHKNKKIKLNTKMYKHVFLSSHDFDITSDTFIYLYGENRM